MEAERLGGDRRRRAALQALVLATLAVLAFVSAFAIARAIGGDEGSAADPDARPQAIDRVPIRPAVPNLDQAGPMPKLSSAQAAGAAGAAGSAP